MFDYDIFIHAEEGKGEGEGRSWLTRSNGKEASSALEEDRLDGISTWTIRQKDPLEGNSLKSLEKLHAARRFCLLLSHAETK